MKRENEEKREVATTANRHKRRLFFGSLALAAVVSLQLLFNAFLPAKAVVEAAETEATTTETIAVEVVPVESTTETIAVTSTETAEEASAVETTASGLAAGETAVATQDTSTAATNQTEAATEQSTSAATTQTSTTSVRPRLNPRRSPLLRSPQQAMTPAGANQATPAVPTLVVPTGMIVSRDQVVVRIGLNDPDDVLNGANYSVNNLVRLKRVGDVVITKDVTYPGTNKTAEITLKNATDSLTEFVHTDIGLSLTITPDAALGVPPIMSNTFNATVVNSPLTFNLQTMNQSALPAAGTELVWQVQYSDVASGTPGYSEPQLTGKMIDDDNNVIAALPVTVEAPAAGSDVYTLKTTVPDNLATTAKLRAELVYDGETIETKESNGFIIDTKKPILDTTGIDGQSVKAGESITIRFKASDDGTGISATPKVELLNGTGAVISDSLVNISVIQDAADASFYIATISGKNANKAVDAASVRITAKDGAGNESTAIVQKPFIIDGVAPAIDILGDEEGEEHRETFTKTNSKEATVYFTIFDNVGVDLADITVSFVNLLGFKIDDVTLSQPELVRENYGGTPKKNLYKVILNTTETSPVRGRVKIVAEDKLGNKKELRHEGNRLVLDASLPVVTWEIPQDWTDSDTVQIKVTVETMSAVLDSSNVVLSAPGLTFTLTDVERDPNPATIDEANKLILTCDAKLANGVTTVDSQVKAEVTVPRSSGIGTKTTSFVSQDSAGNALRIKIDRGAPIISLPPESPTWVKNEATFNINVYDVTPAGEGASIPAIKAEDIKIYKAGSALDLNADTIHGLTYTVQATANPMEFTVTLKLADDKIFDAPLTFEAKDHMASAGTGTDDSLHITKITSGSNYKLDTDKPVILKVDAKLDQWYENEFLFTVKATDRNGQEAGSGIKEVTATAGGYSAITVGSPTEDPENSGEYVYTLKFTIPKGSVVNDKITVNLVDQVGNQGEPKVTDLMLLIDNQPVTFSNFTLSKYQGSENANAFKKGDILAVSFDLHDIGPNNVVGSGVDPSSIELFLNESTSLGKFTDLPNEKKLFTPLAADVTEPDSGTYTYLLEIGTDIPVNEKLIDNKTFKFAKLNVSDKQGTSFVADLAQATDSGPNSQKRYFHELSAPGVLDKYSVTADGSMQTAEDGSNLMLLKTGDTITVSFEATHPVTPKGVVMLDGRKEFLFNVDKDTKPGKLIYTGTYEIPEGIKADDVAVAVKTEVGDAAENTPYTFDAMSVPYHFYGPLSKVIVADSLKLVSQNGLDVAKFADDVTLSFTAKHPVKVVDVEIAGHPVTVKNISAAVGEYKYEGTVKLDPQTAVMVDNRKIPYSFTLQDIVGNREFIVTEASANAPQVTYYDKISVSDLQYHSSNAAAGVARNGDTLTVVLNTPHPVEVQAATINGSTAVYRQSSNNNMTWTLTYQVQSGVTADQGEIPFSVTLGDRAGNTPLTIDQTAEAPIRYFAPLIISNVAIRTSNASGSYTKNGDTVTVSFSTNHPAQMTNAVIAGNSSSASGNGREFSYSWTVTEGAVNDTNTIPFSFSVRDAAGNEAQGSQANTGSQVTYLAPLEVLSTAMTASGGRNGFVRAGDTVSVLSTLNHLATASGTISGRNVSSTAGSANVNATYTFSGNDLAVEGPVRYALVYRDPAGNETVANFSSDDPTIIFDGTPVGIQIAPQFSGFTNESVTFTLTFSDRYLDPNSVSVLVNGIEQITVADRARISDGADFRKTVTLTEENQYRISASARDRAGNVSTFGTAALLTIDKTVPVVVLKSELDGVLLTVPSGFRINDYITIEEENAQNILVSLTDSNGVRDWDVNEPITTEGKKTISITVTDMAGNTSAVVTFEIYVDMTAPKVSVYESLTDTYLNPGAQDSPFIEKAEIHVSLDEMQLEGVKPDQLTVATLMGPDGKVIDLLKETPVNAEGVLIFLANVAGGYVLTLDATDSVGNDLGRVSYEFTIAAKGEIKQNPGESVVPKGTPSWMWPVIIIMVLIFLILIMLLLYKRRKDKETENID